ncbi:sensor domain-containing diguanylate cyclase [Pantoea sp. 18069]|uniref:sensor domain-containing diguanylate cyclase n=1 Tax=Pantoea sp. 18069 TaxID=2681415 RepID=UPI001358FEC8|nr:sensor domain-containing diguanylate cyclase [Pantoea sp. 18069]
MSLGISKTVLRRIVLGNLLVAALLCLATGLSMHANYKADMELGVAVTRNQARSLGLELTAELRLVDNALSSIASRFRTRSFDGLPAAQRALQDMLQEQRALIPFVTALRAADGDGQVLLIASEVTEPFSVQNRDYFEQARRTDQMVVSAPLVSQSFDKWAIVLARRLQAEDDSFQGIVYAIVAAEHFQRLFSQQSLGPDSAMALRTDDARLVARFDANQPQSEEGTGGAVVSEQYHEALRHHAEHGWYITPTLLDGVERITAYQRLTNYPLTVSTGLGTETYLAMWRASAWRAWGLTGLCIVLIALGSVSLYRLQKRERLAKIKVTELLKEQELFIDNDLIGIARLRDRQVLWTNQAMQRLAKRSAQNLLGAPIRILYTDDAAYQQGGELAYGSLRARGKFHTQMQLLGSDAQRLWVDVSGIRLNDEESLWIFVDIDGLKRDEQTAQYLAKHDALTGLANRRALEETLEHELAASLAKAGHALLAVCFMDLDGFKRVNDTYGHDAGDEVLKVVAARLKAQARASDCVARLGGDEFVALLVGLGSPQEAVEIMERCLAAITQPIRLRNAAVVHVGASMGVALNAESGDSAAKLLQLADEAMYAAKRAGKGRIVVARSPHDLRVPEDQP